MKRMTDGHCIQCHCFTFLQLPNSDLIYSISVVTNVGNLFHIDPDTGLITLQNSLDYETRPFFAVCDRLTV